MLIWYVLGVWSSRGALALMIMSEDRMLYIYVLRMSWFYRRKDTDESESRFEHYF